MLHLMTLDALHRERSHSSSQALAHIEFSLLTEKGFYEIKTCRLFSRNMYHHFAQRVLPSREL
jgi:hypothetical protein